MAIAVKVASDIYNAKVNYLLEFPMTPTLLELKERIELILSRECEQRRPAGAPLVPFILDHIQVFDVTGARWTELDHATLPLLLTNGIQLYVFQPPSPWHNDTQCGLPPAVRPPPIPVASPTLIASPLGLPERMSPGAPMAAAAAAASAEAAAAAAAARVRSAMRVEQEVAVQNIRFEEQERKTAVAVVNAEATTVHLVEAQRATVTAQEVFKSAADGVDRAKLAEQDSAGNHRQLLELVSLTENRCITNEKDLLRAEQRLTEIARLVAEHQVEYERHAVLQSEAGRDFESSKVAVEATRKLTEQAENDVKDAEEGLEKAKGTLEEQKEKADQHQKTIAGAEEEVAKLQEEVQLKLTELSAAKEVEGLRRIEHSEAQRQVGLAQARVMAQEEETVKVELRLKEVEGLYKMQELEAERHRELSARCKSELESAKEKEQIAGQTALEAQRAVHQAEDELMSAETALEAGIAKEREARAAHAMANAEVERWRMNVATKQQALERAQQFVISTKAASEEADASTKAAEARKTAQDAETESSETRLQEIRKLHETQLIEVERQRAEVQKVRTELIENQERARNSGADLVATQEVVTLTQEELLRRQAELTIIQAHESEAQAHRAAAEGERSIQQSLMSATERQLLSLREAEQLRLSAELAIAPRSMSPHRLS